MTVVLQPPGETSHDANGRPVRAACSLTLHSDAQRGLASDRRLTHPIGCPERTYGFGASARKPGALPGGSRWVRVGQPIMPLPVREPFIEISDDPSGRVAIHIQHYGRVPDLASEFSPEVLRQAVNKWGRTPREHRILTAARKLSPTAFRIVEAHLIRERALVIQHNMERKTSRPSWSQSRTEEPQPAERETPTVERAEYHDQRAGRDDRLQPQRTSAAVRAPAPRERSSDARKPALPPQQRSRSETLTERAQRELQEAKAQRPKPSRAERTAIQRALDERQESLRDLVEFTPPRPRETLTEKARKQSNAQPAQPRPDRDRDRSR